nr:hypothetical protein [Tanacetum cinerariifolium]
MVYGEIFDINVYDTYSNLFSIKIHYAGRFTDSPNKKYVDGEISFVDMIDNANFKRIGAYAVESRRNLDFKRNDKRRIKILIAVGVDASNGIYSVAYGIVGSKNQYFWTWFLTCLVDDLDLFSNFNFTFIIDRQKGLLPTIAKLFSSVEHRKLEIACISCKHVIAAIHDMADNDWETTQKRKKSKGKIEMVKGDKLTRKGKTVTCSLCQGTGHNKRGCKATGLSDDGQMNDMPSETVPTEHVASKPVGSQLVASQPVSSQHVARKPVARKRVQNKSVAKKELIKLQQLFHKLQHKVHKLQLKLLGYHPHQQLREQR